MNGQEAYDNSRAETLAQYFEKVQWAVRPVLDLQSNLSDLRSISVNYDQISFKELRLAVALMKRNKQCGADSIPAEFLHSICLPCSPASEWILSLFQSIWSNKRVPDSWHLAKIAAIFKKGDVHECSNYRPISLLSSSYKLFALILLNRLRKANVDEFIWPTQFGFRQGARVSDALFMARRFIDKALATKDDKLVLLALDWAKAFDSIMPGPMLEALRRFGLPNQFLEMVSAIYDSRSFFVCDNHQDSSLHTQSAGISQGCPLSPFLFVIVMSVIIHDARADLRACIGDASNNVSEIMYADDTLIVDQDGDIAQIYMDIIARHGCHYGLQFKWDKLEYLCVRCTPALVKPDGSPIKHVTTMNYLGGLLSNDAKVTSDLGRKIGEAMNTFSNLQRIWSHANLPIRKKLALFKSLVLSKLQYGIESMWLNQCERRRLDAFHCKCVRRILKIQHSYFSRISNDQVLAAAKEEPLSITALKQQLKLFGRLAISSSHPSRWLVFDSEDSFEKFDFNPRPVGRPRQCWVDEIYKLAIAISGSTDELANIFHHRCAHSLDPWVTLIQAFRSPQHRLTSPILLCSPRI